MQPDKIEISLHFYRNSEAFASKSVLNGTCSGQSSLVMAMERVT